MLMALPRMAISTALPLALNPGTAGSVAKPSSALTTYTSGPLNRAQRQRQFAWHRLDLTHAGQQRGRACSHALDGQLELLCVKWSWDFSLAWAHASVRNLRLQQVVGPIFKLLLMIHSMAFKNGSLRVCCFRSVAMRTWFCTSSSGSLGRMIVLLQCHFCPRLH